MLSNYFEYNETEGEWIDNMKNNPRVKKVKN